MKFYRYEAIQYAELDTFGDFISPKIPNPKLNLIELNLHRETNKGYWIGFGDFYGLKSQSRWISKTSKKRYAYPTKEEALENYRLRFKKRIKILKYQLFFCEIALSLTKDIKEKQLSKEPF